MSLTHDGLQTPLRPSIPSILVGLLIVGGGIAALSQTWWCSGSALLVLGGLVLLNQVNGVSRVRVTFSKLLVENERLVMGFLIGPSKLRIPWEEFQGAEITGGRIVAKGKSNTLEFGAGQPEPELQEVVRKIDDAARRFREEGGNSKPV
jgi:hypothetical protein